MFYQYLDQVMTAGVDLNLTISKTETGLIVLVNPKVNGLKDPAQNKLTPLVLKGTSKELDANFFPAITAPVRKTSGLLLNMKAYEQQADKAAAASKAEKDKKDQESKEAKEKKDKYDAFIKKADEFEAAGRPEEAITQLKQARLHATEKQTKAVDDKIAVLRAKQSQTSLFDPFAAVASPQAAVPAQVAPPAPPVPTQPAPVPISQSQDTGNYHHHDEFVAITAEPVCRENEYEDIVDFPSEMRPPVFSGNANMVMNF